MKKSIYAFFILILLIFILTGCQSKTQNNEQTNSSEENTSNSNTENTDNNLSNNTSSQQIVKEEISSFKTKLIADYSDKDRDSNIELACSTLDGTVINSNETFSFWDTIGNPTKDKGYKKAKAFDSDGDLIEAYGGGLCQVSTTLYNAILKLDDFDVTERHPHSNDVPYIKDGKDASVSYSSSDLKFKNKSDYSIEIKADVVDDNVEIKILKF